MSTPLDVIVRLEQTLVVRSAGHREILFPLVLCTASYGNEEDRLSNLMGSCGNLQGCDTPLVTLAVAFSSPHLPGSGQVQTAPQFFVSRLTVLHLDPNYDTGETGYINQDIRLQSDK